MVYSQGIRGVIMYFSTLYEWLNWINSIHIKEIELGLDRVKAVAERLQLLSLPCPVIIVGGTNGKGSTVAGLEAIYRAEGYQVGAFTTPFLFKHNEEVRINQEMASDTAFCEAFEKIEAVRGDISLTPFEYHTLAALLIFNRYPLDVWLLEVGLGGRLDAVNIIDADVAIVTSIGIDHVEWLGPTRESIGFEKAGIFRKNKPAVCGDKNPPKTLIEHAKQIKALLYCQGKEFTYQDQGSHWSWTSDQIHYTDLPLTTLAMQNMATVLMAITLLQSKLAVSETAIKKGLANVRLTGRIQIMPGPITFIYDVSHNPDSVVLLATRLHEMPSSGKTLGVFSMLGDKDIVESIKMIKDEIDIWYVAPLVTPRAATLETLQSSFAKAKVDEVNYCTIIQEALKQATLKAKEGDRIIIFGSFHTIASVLKK